jgi:hypothetical protein
VTTAAVTATERRVVSSTALALGGLYVALASLYLWQAARHVGPSIFSDELQFAQLSRSIAETGRAARRGEPFSFNTIYTIIAAPAWWLSSTTAAYGAIKVIGTLLMTSAVVPAYLLARLAVSRNWALFAAAGTGVAPALAYAPVLVEEPVAYPASTLALWLVGRWILVRTRWSFALAVGGCVLGVLSRTQLAILFAVLAVCVLAVVWRSRSMRRWRASWTTADWIGAVVLAVGAVVAFNAAMSHVSESWYWSTALFKDRMLDQSLWAAGALAIGLGVLPAVAGLAGLVGRDRDDDRDRGRRALVTVCVAAIAVFGFYTAIKAAYLSATYGTVVVERNLIYLVPVLFAGTALFLDRRDGRWWAVAAAAAFVLYLVWGTPYRLEQYPYYEAHGLAAAAFANRILVWPAETIQTALAVTTALVAAALVAFLVLRRRRLASAVLVSVIVAATLTWTLGTQVYAANGEARLSKRLYENLPQPVDWLDRVTGGRPAVYLGQQITDPNGVFLLEFWNRSLRNVWSVDGSAPAVGPTLTPNLAAPDGTLVGDPKSDFIVPAGGVEVQGTPSGNPPEGWHVYPLEGPIRLRAAQTGVYSDGWMGGFAAYNRFDVPPGERGLARVTLSRSAWGGTNVPGHVRVRLGSVVVGADGQPAIGQVTDTATDVIDAGEAIPFVLRTPPGPWRAEVSVDPTFVPKELDAGLSETRELGAQVGFSYEARDQLDAATGAARR